MVSHNPKDYHIENESDEFLTRVVVDPCSRKIYLYSNEGVTRSVDCDTPNEFMNVLELIKNIVDDEIIAYAEPLTK
jgi:hypothetical protein